jgi:hypothetical protein
MLQSPEDFKQNFEDEFRTGISLALVLNGVVVNHLPGSDALVDVEAQQELEKINQQEISRGAMSHQMSLISKGWK